MSVSAVVSVVVGLLGMFPAIAASPIYQSVGPLLIQVVGALENGAAGDPVDISFSLKVKDVAGSADFSWTPTPAAAERLLARH